MPTTARIFLLVQTLYISKHLCRRPERRAWLLLLSPTYEQQRQTMSGVSRVVRAGRALQSDHNCCSSSSSCARPSFGLLTSCRTTAGSMRSQGSKKPATAATHKHNAVIAPEEVVEDKKPADANQLSSVAIRLLGLQLEAQPVAERITTTRISWTLRAEMIVERGVVGCRSFTLIAVAGSLVGSILCFFEGCFFVLASFLEFSLAVSQRLDRGGIVQLLIQAIEMFLVGTALLTFGIGIYVMFIKSNQTQQRRLAIAESSLFGVFNLKRLSECMNMESISQGKSRIGHAVVLILQAGMVDKFRNVPLTSGLDLACFAGALLSASATVFLLSRLATLHKTSTHTCIEK